MTDEVGALIEKFRCIAAARAKGDMRAARKLLKTISVRDFPPMSEFAMSHGIMSDPKGALYFIDHDWDNHGGNDPDWCSLFIGDVIRALEQLRLHETGKLNDASRDLARIQQFRVRVP